jgi:hypothetical protein
MPYQVPTAQLVVPQHGWTFAKLRPSRHRRLCGRDFERLVIDAIFGQRKMAPSEASSAHALPLRKPRGPGSIRFDAYEWRRLAVFNESWMIPFFAI